MGNPKEECFESAVEALQRSKKRAGKDTPEIEHRKPWEQANGDKSWSPVNKTWNHALNSVKKTWRMIAENLGIDPGRPQQVRFPDVTVTKPDGSRVVVDTKFDRPSGGRDTWGEKKGMNNRTQRQDYNDINKQETGKDGQDLSLDADTCKCPKGEGSEATQPVYDDSVASDSESPFYDPMGLMLPPTAPAPGAVPNLPPVRLPPIRIPTPVFP